MNEAARGDPIDDDSIVTLLSRVVADAEQVARAEIEVQKAKVGAKIAEARSAVVLLVAALFTVSLALTALVVGVLMTLTPIVGPCAATAIVAGTLLLVAGLFAWLSVRHFKLLFGAGESAL